MTLIVVECMIKDLDYSCSKGGAGVKAMSLKLVDDEVKARK